MISFKSENYLLMMVNILCYWVVLCTYGVLFYVFTGRVWHLWIFHVYISIDPHWRFFVTSHQWLLNMLSVKRGMKYKMSINCTWIMLKTPFTLHRRRTERPNDKHMVRIQWRACDWRMCLLFAQVTWSVHTGNWYRIYWIKGRQRRSEIFRMS